MSSSRERESKRVQGWVGVAPVCAHSCAICGEGSYKSLDAPHPPVPGSVYHLCTFRACPALLSYAYAVGSSWASSRLCINRLTRIN